MRSRPSTGHRPEAGSPLLLTELRHAGGALGRAAENGGALEQLDGDFVMVAIGVKMCPEMARRWAEPWMGCSTRWRPGPAEGGYCHFADRPCDVEAILPAETCKRLGEVKRRWDPDGIVRANHALALEAA